MPAIIQKPSTPEISTQDASTDGVNVSVKRLIEVSTVVLQQAVDLVDNSLTSDEQLTVHSQFMPGSTIGKLTDMIQYHALTRL